MSSDHPKLVTFERNLRPKAVTSLLWADKVHPGWNYANKRAARFYVLNLVEVIGRLDLPITRTAPYFASAIRVIAEETNWAIEQPFEYVCSHTQIYPDKIFHPKTFGRAATIIVAMELAAHDAKRAFNVYDYLRILPAQYFVDRFDRRRLQELNTAHLAMSDADKAIMFGPLAGRTFEEVCLAHIGQSKVGLLGELASGYCVTKYVAENLVAFVNNHYPAELGIGPILSAGQDSISPGLGEGNAAAGLRVPRTAPLDQLPPCI